MKANELRIGNLVTIDNPISVPNLKGKIMTVIGVEELISNLPNPEPMPGKRNE